MESLTALGISALRKGDKKTAQRLLELATSQNPSDIQAWLWLSGAVDTPIERLQCLQQILKIDPENEIALQGITKLLSRNQETMKMQSNTMQPVGLPSTQFVEIPDDSTDRSNSESREETANERMRFSVKPSLLPTFIFRGTISVILILLILIFFGPGIYLFSKEGESTSQLVCFTLVLLLLVIYPFAKKMLGLWLTSYRLTNQHLIIESGILSRKHKTIPIQKIQDVAYEQTFIERFLGIGDVVVESAGEKGAIHLLDLAECKMRTQQILKTVQNYASV